MQCRSGVALVCLLASILACHANARIIHVPSDASTIRDGVNAAAPGDTVLLAAGSYHEYGIQLSSGITVAGESRVRDTVTVDGDERDRVFLAYGRSDVTLRNMSIVDGWSGLLCENSTITIDNVRFAYHMKTGGIRCDESAVRIGHSTFDHNTGSYKVTDVADVAGQASTSGWIPIGGGVSCSESDVQIEFCTFDRNVGYPFGGGICCESSELLVRETTFTHNRGRERGGGISCRDGSAAFIEQCTFDGNMGWINGGGGLSSWNSCVTLVYCDFLDNKAGWDDPAHSGCGGAILAERGSTISAYGCAFVGNRSWERSGGGASIEESDALFSGCDFIDNEADNWGGGLSMQGCSGAGLVALRRCTFVGNRSRYGGGISALAGSLSLDDVSLEANDASVAGGGLRSQVPTDVVSCVFTGNTAGEGGGIALGSSRYVSGSCILVECLFDENVSTGYGGAVRSKDDASVNVSLCTFALNEAPEGSSLSFQDDATGHVQNSIVANSLGASVIQCSGTMVPEITHCCIYANSCGDSLGCGHHDNIFIEPGFCAHGIAEFYLCADSPCRAENSEWGEQIGAYAQGCGSCLSPVEETSWGAIKAMYR